MGGREQLNDVRSNRWALRSPCQAPTLFSEHLLLNLLQKGKSDNQNHKTHVAGPGTGRAAVPLPGRELLGWEMIPEVLTPLQPCSSPSTAGTGEGEKTSLPHLCHEQSWVVGRQRRGKSW